MNPRYGRVAERAAHRCEYCHAPEAIFNFPFEVEHIVPAGSGGSDDESNLALSCRACNVFKADQTEAIDPELRHRRERPSELLSRAKSRAAIRLRTRFAFDIGQLRIEADPLRRAREHVAPNL